MMDYMRKINKFLEDRLYVRFTNFHFFQYIVAFNLMYLSFASYLCRINLSTVILGLNEYYIQNEQAVISNTARMVTLWLFNGGYMLTNLLGGLLCMVYGIRITMTISMLLTGILTIISGLVVKHNLSAFMALRFFIGVAGGVFIPGIQQLVGNYASPDKRTKYMLMISSGNIVSLILYFPLSGLLMERDPFIFDKLIHVTGVNAIFSAIIFAICVFDTPKDNKWMSLREINDIEANLYPKGKPPPRTIHSYPYRQIVTSSATWCLISAHIGKLLILNLFLYTLPSFMQQFLLMSKSMAASVSIIPFVLDFLFHFVYPRVDHLMVSYLIPRSNIRRMNTFVGAIGCSMFLFLLGFVPPRQQILGTVVASLGMLSIPAYQAGYYTAILEYAPGLGLATMSFINFFGSTSAIIEGVSGDIIIKGAGHYHYGKRYSFIFTSLLSLTLSLIYCLLGCSDPQSWSLNAMKCVNATSLTKLEEQKGQSAKESDSPKIVIEEEQESQDSSQSNLYKP